jgi:hypothetical protein
MPTNDELKKVVLQLWEEIDAQIPRCFYDGDGDCARWDMCPLVRPECPRVQLSQMAGIPFDERADSAAPSERP